MSMNTTSRYISPMKTAQLTSTFTLNQLLNSAAIGEQPGEKHPEVDVLAELAKLN